LGLSPATAERDLGLVLIDHGAALPGAPIEDLGEHLGYSVAYVEALVAGNQQERDTSAQDVLERPRQVVGRRELDLGPDVGQLVVEAAGE